MFFLQLFIPWRSQAMPDEILEIQKFNPTVRSVFLFFRFLNPKFCWSDPPGSGSFALSVGPFSSLKSSIFLSRVLKLLLFEILYYSNFFNLFSLETSLFYLLLFSFIICSTCTLIYMSILKLIFLLVSVGSGNSCCWVFDVRPVSYLEH